MASQIQASTTTIKGKTIPVSTFDTIDLAQLEGKEPMAIKRLLASAVSPGWFYLNLRNSSIGKAILEDVPRVYQVSDDYFMQDQATKEKDVRTDQKPSQDRG